MICPECHLKIDFPIKGQKYHGRCGNKARGRIYRAKHKGEKPAVLPIIKQFMTDQEWYQSENYKKILSLSRRGKNSED